MKKILILLLMLFSFAVHAADPDPSQVSYKVTWSPSEFRENGVPLAANEIGGYEIRRKLVNDLVYSNTILPPAATQFDFYNLEDGTHEVVLSVFDTDGVYSKAVKIYTIDVVNNAPAEVTGVVFTKPEQVRRDRVAECLIAENCVLTETWEWR